MLASDHHTGECVPILNPPTPPNRPVLSALSDTAEAPARSKSFPLLVTCVSYVLKHDGFSYQWRD